jgi:hypothetical protein
MVVRLRLFLCFAAIAAVYSNEVAGDVTTSELLDESPVVGNATDHAGSEGLNVVRAPTSILKMMWEAMYHQLHRGHQWAYGIIATILALVMIVDGEFVFKYIVVFMLALCAELMALENMEASFHNGTQTDMILCHVVAAECAVAAAVISYKGYKGIQILLGLCVGALMFFNLKQFLSEHHWSAGFIENTITLLVLGNLCGVLGLVMLISGRIHKKTMALLSSITGGALLAASVAFFVELLCISCFKKSMQNNGFDLPDTCPPWIDFVKTLVSTTHHVGIFNKQKLHVASKDLSADRYIGITFWFVFACIGLCIQIKKEKSKGKKSEKASAQRGSKIEAESSSAPASEMSASSTPTGGRLAGMRNYWRSKKGQARTSETPLLSSE